MNTPLHARNRTRVLDAVLFGFFVYDGFVMPGIPIPVPVSEIAALVLLAIAVFRPRRFTVESAQWMVPAFSLLLAYLIVESAYNDVDWFRRAMRLCVMMGLVWALTSGRIDMVSGLKGIGVALMINAILFYLGLAPDNYAGALTGYLGDKNVAGLYYTIFPLLIIPLLQRKSAQVACFLAGVLAAFLTGSRTSLAAYAAASLWFILTRRLPVFARAVVGVSIIAGLQYAETNLARAWIFSSREGSDLLRERIDQAAAAKTADAPWYGLGLGESRVQIADNSWFFHDSYLGLLVEGGWVLLVFTLGVYVWCGFRPLSTSPRTHSLLIVESTTMALLVCAWKLGEVFLSIPGFVLLAYAVLSRTNIPPSFQHHKVMQEKG